MLLPNDQLGSRVGLLGGTFDPVHLGHTALAKAVQEKLQLDSVFFVPSFLPPHKGAHPPAAFQTRVAMLEKALAPYESFFLSLIECERAGPSYTCDTLAAIRRDIPKTVQLFFVMGGDAFLEIHTWKRFETLLDCAHLVVVSRSGETAQSLENYAREKFPSITFGQECGPHGGILLLQMPPVPISSSAIRDRMRAQKGCSGLVHQEVEEFIEGYRLYRR